MKEEERGKNKEERPTVICVERANVRIALTHNASGTKYIAQPQLIGVRGFW